MTNEEKLAKSLNNFQYDILSALADDAEERGEEELALGYRWLRDNKKWPYQYLLYDSHKYSFDVSGKESSDKCSERLRMDFWSQDESYFPTPFEALKKAAELEGKRIKGEGVTIDFEIKLHQQAKKNKTITFGFPEEFAE